MVISAGKKEKNREKPAGQREPRPQENAVLPIFAQQVHTEGLSHLNGRGCFARTEPENRSPDAVKGLPSRDLNCTPLEEVSPGQSQGTLAAKGKENFTATAPPGLTPQSSRGF